ncbi:MAG TPA: radical SAM protein, partial [Candidatus Bathyarchaeota archaeon]|nr:radical SAM protein [Candidatus Bathyarchaeota archaeon]HEX68999.1 radical SAM protein [Candidatus Bathyarchaeota archaeon]
KEIFKEVRRKVEEAISRNENIDYLTFVPDGEPTLDMNLGKEIDALKQFGIRIAVITNSSLIWDEKVREELSKAEWVSLKVDAVSKEIWKKINRPHKALNLEKILNGIKEFGKEFVTETMLINGVNDNKEELKKIADFLSAIEPKKSYISIPIRPPAEKWVRRASEQAINLAYQIFSERGISVEFLLGYEGNEFAFTGNVEKDLLSITSVHPMRKDAVEEFLRKAEADWSVIERLIKENKLIEIEYGGNKFYMRRL